ncbi:zinc finger protein 41-like [Venturia canescens]|uniref:zinc finger protein 41-like n=1 Tax=Venturia canescens TaxID=32260 RepID=UPI001C9BD1F0|nr:zinc finger protein 41-like [Venturia canescens]
MVEVSLYDSAICRLCAENNGNGELLYTVDGDEIDLSSMVNRYLPIKIRDDGKLPRTICPGCNIQLEATVQFFELLVEGQRKIREMWKEQVECQRRSERERLKNERENLDNHVESSELENLYNENGDEEFAQQIIIKILPDGSMYAAEHDMSLQMEGLNKPRRKRGRPPKNTSELEDKDLAEDIVDGVSQEDEEKIEDDLDDTDGDGRRRRKRKVPKRFSEAVQGKELERIFKEEGVIDDDDDGADNVIDDPEERVKVPSPDGQEEIIGHLETEEGKDLGELVIVNRSRGRGRPKLRRRKNKFTCKLCGRGFLQRSRYIMHKSFHKGIKFQCSECKKQFTNRENCALHQKTTGHSGEGIIDGIEIDEPHLNESVSDTKNFEQTSCDISHLKKLTSPILKSESSSMEKSRPEKLEKSTDNRRENSKESLETENKEMIKRSSSVEPENSLNKAKSSESESPKKSSTSKERFVTSGKIVPGKDGKPFACSVCNKTFIQQASLKEHQLTHETNKADKGYPCDVCGKVLNHPSSVIYHKEAEHNGRRFVCNKCGKSFKHKQLLQRHQLVHSDDRPYLCGSCNASFKTKANLINHQFTHTGEKKYSCELCGQQFAHKTSLTLHYRWHTGHKPYSCQVCNKSFSQNGNLQEHMRIHTGEKPYCCDHCGRKFTTSSQFKLHVKRHTGERPWKCEFCAKTFLHKDTWKCHVRRHKGERPFQCAHCNRGFTEQWALKKHLRLHTGEKPYSCEICGKAFADCSNLTKHRKVHRDNKIVAINEMSKASNDSELWQILPAGNDSDEMGDHMTQVIGPEETSEDGIPQIIYVSYQDPDDPNQSRTLHFVDVGVMDEKEGISTSVEDRQSLPTLDVSEPVQMISKRNAQEEEQEDPAEQIEMELAEQNLQLQITDEEGNPIPLSVQDARQLLAGGRFVSELADGQAIRVSDELAQQLNVQVQQDVDEMEEPVTTVSTASNLGSTTVSDAAAIVKALEDEDTDATVVAAVNQMAGEPEIDDGAQTIEFTTQDGQKVRLVTSYHVDPMQLTSEYLTIV